MDAVFEKAVDIFSGYCQAVLYVLPTHEELKAASLSCCIDVTNVNKYPAVLVRVAI